MLETYKPILALSTLEESSMECENTAMMEQVIMEEAKQNDKESKRAGNNVVPGRCA